VAVIRIPPVLRPDAAGSRTVTVDGATVRAALTSLVSLHPALTERVLAGDALPSYLNAFVDGDDIRLLGGLDTKVAPASTILLLPAVAGGT
jgi:molybdopterin synthase sulfur carrier subunit